MGVDLEMVDGGKDAKARFVAKGYQGPDRKADRGGGCLRAR